jgi:hypothetical protein
LTNQKHGASVKPYLLAVFFGKCTSLMCLLPATANSAYMLGQNHFAEPNRHVLPFFI